MKIARKLQIGWTGLLLAVILTGCAGLAQGTAPAPPAPTSSPTSRFPVLSESDLRNADYSSVELKQFLAEADRNTPIHLVDGHFRYVYQAGAATGLVIQYVRSAGGDLNADGRDDAAVLLRVLPGGSGNFYFLAAVLNQAGEPRTAAAVLLGDRVKVESLTIAEGEIILELLTHGPTDPLCCPTQRVERRFQLKQGALLEIEQVQGD